MVVPTTSQLGRGRGGQRGLHMMSYRRRPPLVILLGFVLAACSGGSTPSASGGDPLAGSPAAPSAAASASAVPSASAGPSASAAPSASASADGNLDLCPVDFETCRLLAGTYSPSRVIPAMTFTLDEGWDGYRHFTDAFSIGKIKPTLFLSMASDVKVGFGGIPVEAGIAGFELLLRSVDPLTVGKATPVTVGGKTGIQVDVVATGEASGLYRVAEDAYNLAAGQKARFIVLDVGGTTVVFVFESMTEAEFDAVVAEVQPVLDSITFE